MKRFQTLMAAVLLGGAALAHAQQQQAPAERQGRAQAGVQRPGLPAAERRFLAEASRMGHAEVEAGRIAQSRGKDDAVREYGAMLVDDHQQANTRLQRIAQELGLRLPTGPSEQQRRRLQELSRMDAASFDREFMQRMIEDHRKALSLFQAQAQRRGGRDETRNYAREVIPTLQRHLERAGELHVRLRSNALEGNRAAGAGIRSDANVRRDAGGQARERGVAGRSDEQQGAREQVRDAVQVVQKMKSDPQIAQMLQRARGVFIVPNYGRGALGVGVQGGEGVLVTRQGDTFGSPAFYNIAGVSVGAQAGVAAGEVAFLLMTERAVQQFRSDRKFSLTVDAGLTIATYSARGHASTGKVQDVLVWSDTEGAYAGLSVGITDVFTDSEANRAYYGRPDATPLTILGGRLEDPYGNALARVLGA